MEEIDLCWRIKNMGYRVQFCHESRIYHIGGGTLPERDHKKTYLNFRNNIILLYKNLPPDRMARVLLPRVVLDYISLFQFLARLEFRNFWAVVKAHAVLLSNLNTLRRIRHENLETCDPALHPEILNASIVYNFFLKNRKLFRDLDFNKKPHRSSSVR
jgi:GT2 family glycosyltransferase